MKSSDFSLRKTICHFRNLNNEDTKDFLQNFASDKNKRCREISKKAMVGHGPTVIQVFFVNK